MDRLELIEKQIYGREIDEKIKALFADQFWLISEVRDLRKEISNWRVAFDKSEAQAEELRKALRKIDTIASDVYNEF